MTGSNNDLVPGGYQYEFDSPDLRVSRDLGLNPAMNRGYAPIYRGNYNPLNPVGWTFAPQPEAAPIAAGPADPMPRVEDFATSGKAITSEQQQNFNATMAAWKARNPSGTSAPSLTGTPNVVTLPSGGTFTASPPNPLEPKMREQQYPGGYTFPVENTARAGGLPVLAPTNVPDNIKPLLNYWAEYHGVDPGVFARMVQQESSFDVNSVSGKGAKGLTQLMPGTAEEMGVKDPFDISENLRGGAQYLKKMLDKAGGDYNKALLMYNGQDPDKPSNPAYANNILGYGSGSGPKINLAGPGGTTGSSGIKHSTPNALELPAVSVPGGQGGAGGPKQYEAPPKPNEIADATIRRSLMLQMLGQALKGMKLTPMQVGYDPFKVQQAGEPPPGSERVMNVGPDPGLAYRPQQSPIATHFLPPGQPIPASNALGGGGVRRNDPGQAIMQSRMYENLFT